MEGQLGNCVEWYGKSNLYIRFYVIVVGLRGLLVDVGVNVNICSIISINIVFVCVELVMFGGDMFEFFLGWCVGVVNLY